MNEKEIVGVPDIPPLTVKKWLKTTEKQPLSSVLKNIPALNIFYQSMRILERGSKISLTANSDSSPLVLFQLFITKAHLNVIAIHTNSNITTKRAQDVHQKNQKVGDDRSEYIEEETRDKEQFEKREGNVEPKK